MKRNKFSLSNTKLFTCDMGELVPCGMMEVLPGDSIQQTSAALIRCAPMLAPPMHPVDVRIHHWFVPNRLLWDGWEDFITGGPDGNDAAIPPRIAVPGGGFAVGSLADYLGIPPSAGATQFVSALPFRAYAMIWNDWYRDQDLQTPLVISKAASTDSTTSTLLQNCAWEKDYLTSSRPWEQKGPAVSIPLVGTAPVIIDELGATPGVRTFERNASAAGGGVNVVQAGTGGADFALTADLSTAGSVTVNSLRQSLAIQRFEEGTARWGSRYVEYLARLGVRSSDGRLSRPEYLGGGVQRISFSEIVQTAADGSNPVGTLRGHGINAMRSNRYRRFFEEHGYILTLMSVRPKSIYASGMDRGWFRTTKYDYWQRELEHIGQQSVLRREVWFNTGITTVFGYQDRYDEYRQQRSTIAGEYRTTLNYWHFGRAFGSAPALNSTFVSCVPVETPFAVSSSDVLQIQVRHSIQARRLLAQSGNSFIM